MKTAETTGTVQKGTVTIHNRDRFMQAVGRMNGRIILRAEQHGSRRSLEANAYLWGVVYPTIGNHLGYSSEEVHEIYKKMFLEREYFLTNTSGEVVDTVKAPGTTRTMSKMIFWEYVDKVIMHAGGELGITIPPANPNYKEEDNG